MALASVLLCVAVSASAATGEHYRVLLLHSFRQSAPVNADWYSGIARGFERVPGLRVDIDVETLDMGLARDESYFEGLKLVYRRKYADPKPQLIIATYTPALRFLLDSDKELFPGIPILSLGADSQFVVGRKFPPNVTGITTFADIAGTLELALQIHPGTEHVAVIAGAGPLDEAFDRRARQALQPFESRVKLRWLTGMSLEELTSAVHQLPRHSVILYLVAFQDRNRKSYIPRNLVESLSAAADAPIYGLWDTLLGHGVVGGRMITIENDGLLAAQMALRILRGELPSTIPFVVRTGNEAIVDGRELARWQIDENRLPAGTRIRHRQLSPWDQYRTEIVTVMAIIVMQGLLIIALLSHRRRLRRTRNALREEGGRRREAETMAAGLRGRLARFSKDRSLGTMATAISHEINQPLTAIQNYAQAAKRRLQSDIDDKPKLIELFGKIEGQAERAGAITRRVRSLVNRGEHQLQRVSVGPLLEEVVRVMEPEIAGRGCAVKWELVGEVPQVLADSLEIQLVLVNLVQNAMQSISSDEKYDKLVTIVAQSISDEEVRVSVMDRGRGVDPDRISDIFEPLSSGTNDGMGMGLAIARAIIDAHGGRIWYEPNPDGGAIFRFILRNAQS